MTRHGTKCAAMEARVTDRKRTISGPGASDFLTATGGEDVPETSPDKGDGALRENSEILNPRNLQPDLEPGTGERGVLTGEDDATVADEKNR